MTVLLQTARRALMIECSFIRNSFIHIESCQSGGQILIELFRLKMPVFNVEGFGDEATYSQGLVLVAAFLMTMSVEFGFRLFPTPSLVRPTGGRK